MRGTQELEVWVQTANPDAPLHFCTALGEFAPPQNSSFIIFKTDSALYLRGYFEDEKQYGVFSI